MTTEKKKVGLFLPVPLADALDEMTERVGKKQKWLIVGAALVRFLQADEATQNSLIRQVKIADLPGGSFPELIGSARRSVSHGGEPAKFQELVAIDDAESHRGKRAEKRRKSAT